MRRGFTLTELVIVIAIIAVLSTIVVATVSNSHAKANDAKRISDLRTIALDLQLYQERFHSTPINRNPCCGYPDTSPNFLQELVDQKYLPSNPKAPDNDATNPYYYYDYGSGNSIGMVLATQLEGSPPSTGYPNTCRPWLAGQNWCDQASNHWYCICTPY